MAVPFSGAVRAYWLSLSLVPLGRFTEAAEHETEALHLAEPMRHAYSIGVLRLSAGTLHLWKGEWTSACVRLDKGISMFRASNIAILVARMVASAAWALAELGESSEALNRLHEARQLLDRLVEKGMVGMWSYPSLAMGRAYLLLGRLDEA